MDSRTKATSSAEEAAAENVYDHILSKIIVEVTCGFHRAAKTGVLPYSNIMAGSVLGRSVLDASAMNGCAMEEGGVVKDDGNIQSGINNDGDLPAAASGDGPHPCADATRKNDVEALTKTAEEVESHAISTAEEKSQGGEGHEVSNMTSVVGNGNSVERDDKEVVGHRDGNDAKKRKLQFSNVESADTATANTAIQAKIGSSPSRNITNKNAPASASSSSNLLRARTDIYGRTPGREPKYTIPCPNNCGRRISSIRLAQHLEKCLGLASRRRNSSSAGGSSSGRRGGASASLSSTSKGSSSKGGKVSRQGKQTKKRSSKVI